MRTNELRLLTDNITYNDLIGYSEKTRKNEYSTDKSCSGSIRNRSRKFISAEGKINYDTEIILTTDIKISEGSKIHYSNKEYEIIVNYQEPTTISEVYFYYLKEL